MCPLSSDSLYSVPSSAHRLPSPNLFVTSISPPLFPNLPQGLTPPLAWALQVLWDKGSAEVRSLWHSLIHAVTSLCWPLCSVHLSLLPSATSLTLSPHYLTHFLPLCLFLSFCFSTPSLARAALGWHIDWGFYSPPLTSSFSPPLSPFSPENCNAQTSLICVFALVSCFLKCLNLL